MEKRVIESEYKYYEIHMAVPGEGVTDGLELTLLGTKDVIVHPFLKRIIDDFNKYMEKSLQTSFLPESDIEAVKVALGSDGNLFTKDDLKKQNSLNGFGKIIWRRKDGDSGIRDACDFIAMRRDFCQSLLMVVILDTLGREQSPFTPYEKTYLELGVPKWILRPSTFDRYVELSQYYDIHPAGRVYYNDYFIAVDEDGIAVIYNSTMNSSEGSDRPKSSLIFSSKEVLIEWCTENKIIEKYRVLEKKAYAMLKKSWLSEMPAYSNFQDKLV